MANKALLIRDLDLVKDILVTNFTTFNKNDFTVDTKIDPLLAVNPFVVSGKLNLKAIANYDSTE